MPPNRQPPKRPGKYLKAQNRKHELQLAIIEAIKENSDVLDWIIIIAGTLGAAALAAITAFLQDEPLPSGNDYVKNGEIDWAKILTQGLASTSGLAGLTAILGKEKPTTLIGFMGASATAGIVGIATAHLMVRATMGGEKGEGGSGGLAKLVGLLA